MGQAVEVVVAEAAVGDNLIFLIRKKRSIARALFNNFSAGL